MHVSENVVKQVLQEYRKWDSGLTKIEWVENFLLIQDVLTFFNWLIKLRLRRCWGSASAASKRLRCGGISTPLVRLMADLKVLEYAKHHTTHTQFCMAVLIVECLRSKQKLVAACVRLRWNKKFWIPTHTNAAYRTLLAGSYLWLVNAPCHGRWHRFLKIYDVFSPISIVLVQSINLLLVGESILKWIRQ